ncbi:hypothetical protein LAUMK41_00642 [Mycobacterium attenuatum]|nr:hypothetical protein LAUMK41_00642 [Mycobacterium attenuatum]
MHQQHAIEFFFIAESGTTGVWGFHWLIEWSTSSFYIKCLNPGLQSSKVSLHGPDPKHPGRQHLRYDLDKPDVVEKAKREGGRWFSGSDPLPFYFSGRQVNDHAAHIVRFSAGWDTFMKGAPVPDIWRGPRQKSTFRGLAPAPEKDHVSHVDVYLSLGDPYWPNEAGARAAWAGMGPITNAIGMNLTAVSVQSPVTWEPDPFGDVRGDTPLDQCVRGLAAVVDETSLLWLCEKVIPYTELDALAAKQAEPPGPSGISE